MLLTTNFLITIAFTKLFTRFEPCHAHFAGTVQGAWCSNFAVRVIMICFSRPVGYCIAEVSGLFVSACLCGKSVTVRALIKNRVFGQLVFVRGLVMQSNRKSRFIIVTSLLTYPYKFVCMLIITV